MKKERIFFVIGIVFVLFFLESSSANFVCGVVNDSDDNMSAQWYNARIFYEGRDNYGSCEISPAGNKFCCDVEEIPGSSWKIGDEIFGEIFNPESGYFAGPVSVITTGDGYDIFPEMKLKKAMEIYNPDGKLFFSNESKFLLNASFESPYNFVEIEKDGERETLCDGCSNFSDNISGNYGWNNVSIFSSFGNNVFSKNIGLWILKGFDFKRSFGCNRCVKNVIKREKEVNVEIAVNLSHKVENLELREYVPVDFKILETDARVEEYSPSHNVMIWNVSGKNIVKDYKIKAPKIWFFPRKYIFKTELENQVLDESVVKVYRWIKFFSFGKKMKFRTIKRVKNYKIGPNNPLVIKPRKKGVEKLVIFPNAEFNKVNFNLEELGRPRIPNLISYYKFDTNLKENDIDKIYVESKIRKSYMRWRGYHGVKAYVFENGNWVEKEMEKYNEDRRYFYYKTFLEPSNKIVISGIRNSFWDIFDFFD